VEHCSTSLNKYFCCNFYESPPTARRQIYSHLAYYSWSWTLEAEKNRPSGFKTLKHHDPNSVEWLKTVCDHWLWTFELDGVKKNTVLKMWHSWIPCSLNSPLEKGNLLIDACHWCLFFGNNLPLHVILFIHSDLCIQGSLLMKVVQNNFCSKTKERTLLLIMQRYICMKDNLFCWQRLLR